MIRVLIAEDHRLVRQGVAALLSKAQDILIVGQASNGVDAVKMAEQLSPDVVLMDIDMPSMDGFSAASQIHTLHRNTKILILSMSANADLFNQAIEHRVHGYISKDCSRLELLAAIRAVHQDKAFFGASVLAQRPTTQEQTHTRAADS
jgi:two-component system, NarL family, nitrate/nitrite response regulator NarL